jgi:hypothetical protein
MGTSFTTRSRGLRGFDIGWDRWKRVIQRIGAVGHVGTGVQCEPLTLLAVRNVPKGVGQRGRGKVPVFLVCWRVPDWSTQGTRGVDYCNNEAVTV